MSLTSNPHTCSLGGVGGCEEIKKQVNLSAFDDFLGIGARGEE